MSEIQFPGGLLLVVLIGLAFFGVQGRRFRSSGKTPRKQHQTRQATHQDAAA